MLEPAKHSCERGGALRWRALSRTRPRRRPSPCLARPPRASPQGARSNRSREARLSRPSAHSRRRTCQRERRGREIRANPARKQRVRKLHLYGRFQGCVVVYYFFFFLDAALAGPCRKSWSRRSSSRRRATPRSLRTSSGPCASARGSLGMGAR